MKTSPLHSLLVATVVVLSAVAGRADPTAHAQILKQRDAVLSQILAGQESRRAVGIADEDAILAAQVALYSFRRDAAPTPAGKIQNQELIVAVFEKQLAVVEAKVRIGGVTNAEVLIATDRVLQAKQILEELKLSPKTGG